VYLKDLSELYQFALIEEATAIFVVVAKSSPAVFNIKLKAIQAAFTFQVQ
jgi:hypothetical protein